MRHATARVSAALTATLIVSSSALAAPGLRLSWDHCSADGQVENKTFACDVNTGTEALVLSYESLLSRSDRVGVEMTLHLVSGLGPMPAWWQVFTAGTCRPAALTCSLLDPLAANCSNPWDSRNAAAAIADLVPDPFDPNVRRLRAIAAVPASEPFAVGPGIETFAIQLVIRNNATVGTGACAACVSPICIGFGAAKLVGSSGTDNVIMTAGGPNAGGGPANVTWQGAYTAGYTVGIDGPSYYEQFVCAPSGPDPVHASTWGAVKALYR